MSLYWSHKSIKLAVWKIEESVDELLTLSHFSNEYISYLKKNMPKSDFRQKEWIAVRLLLKILMQKEIFVEYNKIGAPYIPNSNFNISITHTKGYAAVIVHEQEKAGIDIEYFSERVQKIKTRFLSKEEILFIDQQKNNNPQTLLYWCAKETLYKLINSQNIDFAKHLNVLPFIINQQEGKFNGIVTKFNNPIYFELQYKIFTDFMLVWH